MVSSRVSISHWGPLKDSPFCQFISYYSYLNSCLSVLQTEPVVRLFDVLRKDDADHVTQADLKQMLNGILMSHPGLEFLQETPEFQERYDSVHLQHYFL